MSEDISPPQTSEPGRVARTVEWFKNHLVQVSLAVIGGAITVGTSFYVANVQKQLELHRLLSRLHDSYWTRSNIAPWAQDVLLPQSSIAADERSGSSKAHGKGPVQSLGTNLDFQRARVLCRELQFGEIGKWVNYADYLVLAEGAAMVGNLKLVDHYLNKAETDVITSGTDNGVNYDLVTVHLVRADLHYGAFLISVNQIKGNAAYQDAAEVLEGNTDRLAQTLLAEVYGRWSVSAFSVRDKITGTEMFEKAKEIYSRKQLFKNGSIRIEALRAAVAETRNTAMPFSAEMGAQFSKTFDERIKSELATITGAIVKSRVPWASSGGVFLHDSVSECLVLNDVDYQFIASEFPPFL